MTLYALRSLCIPSSPSIGIGALSCMHPSCVGLCNMLFLYICHVCLPLYICVTHAGVAVAAAGCAMESPYVTSASKWQFEVTTGIS